MEGICLFHVNIPSHQMRQEFYVLLTFNRCNAVEDHPPAAAPSQTITSSSALNATAGSIHLGTAQPLQRDTWNAVVSTVPERCAALSARRL